MAKRKSTKNKQRSTKYTYKSKVFDVRLLLQLFYSYFVDDSQNENSSNHYMYITAFCCQITR
jgi:hypothetical protein